MSATSCLRLSTAWRRSRCVYVRILGLLGVLTALVFACQGASGGVEAGNAVVRVELRPVELVARLGAMGTAMELLGASMEGREMVFTKEPDFEGRPVERGAILTGGKGVLGYAWDESAASLYLDANRNRDLTDDPEAVFHGSQRGASQVFDNVHLTLVQDGVPLAYRMAVTLSRDAKGAVRCSTAITSGWEGTFTADGAEYRMTVVDNLDAVIDATDWVALEGVAPRTLTRRVNPAEHLVLAGHHFIPSFAFVDAPTGPELVATLEPWRAAYGTVRLEGKSVERLRLQGPVRVDLANPPETFPLAVGEYTVELVSVGGNHPIDLPSTLRVVVVEEGKTVSLRVGGPLRRSVAVARNGSRLRISEGPTVGVGGESYGHPRDLKPSNIPPGCAVLQGDKILTSATFRYG